MRVSNRRAVVTGGAGFLGSHLAERLLTDGFQVLCIDNLLTGVPDNVQALLGHEHFHFRQADVTEPFDVDGPVAAVFHLASPASPLDYHRFPIQTLRAGSLGTLNALELAEAKGARFVLASTSEAYGDPQVHPQPETYWGNVNPVGPRAVYDEAKRFAEAVTTAYRTRRSVDTSIVRIFNTYGPRMRPHDGRAIPAFIDQALSGKPLTVAGDGSQTRSLCYVDDLVEGLVRVLHADHAGPINLGNPNELTVLELATTIRRLVGSGSPITFVPRPVDDPGLRRPDVRLARSVLEWEPQVGLEEGLMLTVRWFRQCRGSDGLVVSAAAPEDSPARDPEPA